VWSSATAEALAVVAVVATDPLAHSDAQFRTFEAGARHGRRTPYTNADAYATAAATPYCSAQCDGRASTDVTSAIAAA
jgi:hypothetical protein